MQTKPKGPTRKYVGTIQDYLGLYISMSFSQFFDTLTPCRFLFGNILRARLSYQRDPYFQP